MIVLKCQCGTVVQHTTEIEVTHTGVHKYYGRCQNCFRRCRWRAVVSPREQVMLCDCTVDSQCLRMREKNETRNDKKRSHVR